MLTDPIADMLTRIRNANAALHDSCEMPSSSLKTRLATLLEDEGYIVGHTVEDGEAGKVLRIELKYDEDRRRVISGLSRVSRPGRRVYVDKGTIPRVLGGMGCAVVSTSQGLVTGHEARRRGIGGEVLCKVW